MAQPSPSPTRYPSGVSTDFPYGPLANYGLPNPFSYHSWVDDFDGVLRTAYTSTVTNAGTIASAAGNGGTMLFTTDALATDLASLQISTAGFAFTAGKKAFFLARLKVSSAAGAAFNVGLIQQTTTPFTVADGIYFGKATGSAANLTLTSVVGSAATSVAIPTAAYTLSDNTTIDLAWYLDRNGNVMAFVGAQLVGYLPQSGTGSTNPTRGPCAALTAPTLTAVNLTPTLAVRSGTASAKTMTVDFVLAGVER